MKFRIEYCCPNEGCSYRGTTKECERHLPKCPYSRIQIKTEGNFYSLEFDYDLGMLLERACNALTDNLKTTKLEHYLSDKEENDLFVFSQRLVWALSGDEEMQGWAKRGEVK